MLGWLDSWSKRQGRGAAKLPEDGQPGGQAGRRVKKSQRKVSSGRSREIEESPGLCLSTSSSLPARQVWQIHTRWPYCGKLHRKMENITIKYRRQWQTADSSAEDPLQPGIDSTSSPPLPCPALRGIGRPVSCRGSCSMTSHRPCRWPALPRMQECLCKKGALVSLHWELSYIYTSTQTRATISSAWRAPRSALWHKGAVEALCLARQSLKLADCSLPQRQNRTRTVNSARPDCCPAASCYLQGEARQVATRGPLQSHPSVAFLCCISADSMGSTLLALLWPSVLSCASTSTP